MTDFIKRNMPVFIIGLVTVLVFVAIIIFAQRNPAFGPKLEQIKNEQLVTDSTPTVGPRDSKVVFVEFSDFECPACKAFAPVVYDLIEKYSDRVLFAYKHLPLPQHKNAVSAAIAAEAAHNQGKFWEYGEKLFDAQPDFSKEKYIQLATDLGLDVERFTADLADTSLLTKIENDRAQAARMGLDTTPTFILNGKPLTIKAYEDLENYIKDELIKNNISPDTNETTQATPSAEITVDTETDPSYATIDRTHGIIEIDYIDVGFRPNNVKAILGQLARWTNRTKRDMIFQQLIPTYSEMAGYPKVKPGETIELRLTTEGLWTYKEYNNKHYASIYVVKP